MKLWVDDERPPPDDTWTWAKTDKQAMSLWAAHLHDLTELSLDHDLGEGGDTRTIATAILGLAHAGEHAPPRWYVHSSNPVGVEWLTGVLERADKYWRQNQTKANLAASYGRKAKHGTAV